MPRFLYSPIDCIYENGRTQAPHLNRGIGLETEKGIKIEEAAASRRVLNMMPGKFRARTRDAHMAQTVADALVKSPAGNESPAAARNDATYLPQLRGRQRPHTLHGQGGAERPLR